MQDINKNLRFEKADLLILGEKWLEAKIQRMRNLLKIAEPDEALYREIMLSLGYPKNKVQFLELALMLPFREIQNLKERKIIEKALLYRAGFIESKERLPDTFDFSLRMDKSVWNFKGIRPANHPEKRIMGISYLLSETASDGLANFIIQKIHVWVTSAVASDNVGAPLAGAHDERAGVNPVPTNKAKFFVNKIMDFKGIGIQRKREMFFNIILPFCIAFLEDKEPEIIQFLNAIFIHHPPLSENSLTKKFRSIIGESSYADLNTSTKTYFGIHLYIKKDSSQ